MAGRRAWRPLQRELGRLFAEVADGGIVQAIVAGAEVDGIEVELEDLILGAAGLDIEGQHKLLSLAAEGALVGEEQVLDELLGDGAGALLNLTVLQVDEGGAHDAFHVEAVMGVKAVILDGDDGVGEIIRYIGKLHVAGTRQAAFDGLLQEKETLGTVPKVRVLRFTSAGRRDFPRRLPLGGWRWLRELMDAVERSRPDGIGAAGEEKADEKYQYEAE